MHRRKFLMALLAAPASAAAQNRRFRIGWLVFGGATLGPIDQSLKDALAQRGLVDGGSIEIIYRYANGAPARLAELAGELVAQKPDMLLGVGGDVIKALFEASKGGIPIVGGVSDNPMRAGIAASLARPGKNFTGVTFLTDEMAAKRIELLKEVAPNAKRVAAIFNPLHLDDELTFARRGAESLGINLTSHPISNVADLDVALRAASASGADSLFVVASRLTNFVAPKIAQHGQRAAAARDCFVARIRRQWVAYCPMGRAGFLRPNVSLAMWKRFSREQSPPICRSSNPRNSSWSSTSRPPRRSASPSRNCSCCAPTM